MPARPRKPWTVTMIIIAIVPVLIVVAVGVWLKASTDATWPVNRIPRIVEKLVTECPGGELTEVSVERSQVSVQCTIDGDRHLYFWDRGRVKQQTLRPVAGRTGFGTDDFSITAVAQAISSGRATKVTITGSAVPGEPDVVLTDQSGEHHEVTGSLEPR